MIGPELVLRQLLPRRRSHSLVASKPLIGCRPELQRLRDQIQKDLDSDLIHVSSFCKNNSIDLELFRRLPVGAYHWLGNDREWVFGTGLLESLRYEVLDSLSGLDGSVSSLFLDVLRLSSCSPIELSTLFPEREFPLAFISVVVTPMSKEGALDGKVKDGHYIPNKYIQAQQEDLVHELRKERILGA